MKLTVISFIFCLLLLPSINALNFSIEFPDIVEEAEEFLVSIVTLEEVVGDYDVKIFVHDDKKSSSEIFDPDTDEWESTFYYLSAIYPIEEDFELRAHHIGETEICVRLRETGNSNFDEVCEEIEVTALEENNTSPPESSGGPEDPEDGDEDKEDKKDEDKGNVSEQVDNNPQNSTPGFTNEEKIILSNENVDSNSNNSPNSVFFSEDGKIMLWVLFSFTAIVVILLVLLALRRL